MLDTVSAFILLVSVVIGFLLYASWYDYKHKKIEYWLITVVILLGLLYMLIWSNLIETLAILIFIGFIFGTATLFTFGFGDFLLLLGLGCFMDNLKGLYLFLGLFLLFWAVATALMIYKQIKIHRVSIRSRKFFLTEYPFAFVITISFILWSILAVLG